jgi:hypothetical protein
MPWKQEVYVPHFMKVHEFNLTNKEIGYSCFNSSRLFKKTRERMLCALYFNLQLIIKSMNLSPQGASVDNWILTHKTDINLTTQSILPTFLLCVDYNNTMRRSCLVYLGKICKIPKETLDMWPVGETGDLVGTLWLRWYLNDVVGWGTGPCWRGGAVAAPCHRGRKYKVAPSKHSTPFPSTQCSVYIRQALAHYLLIQVTC